MKSTVSVVVTAIFALCSATLVNGQSSTPRAKSAATPSSKASTSSASAAPDNPASAATPASTTSAARTDLYHVHFTKAAPGKSIQLADNLKAPDPTDPMPGHSLVLRHQQGDAWDYAVIQHMGTSTKVDATRPAPSPSVRDLSDWHTDTLVNGPSWAEFTKAMGISESDKSKTAGSVYVVSVYRPVPGHREQLEKMLGEAPGAGDTSSGTVLMQHLEGDAWTFLSIARYNSWQDFATNEVNSVASTSKNEGGWFQLREHISYHTDTLTNRIFP